MSAIYEDPVYDESLQVVEPEQENDNEERE